MQRVLAAVALSCACASEPPAEACTLIGCGEVARIDVVTVADTAALANASIEVCRNADCVRGPVPAPQGDVGDATYLDGALHVRLDVVRTPAGVQLVATIDQLRDVTTAADGDRYTIVVRRDATVVTERSWTATYRESFPNGEACERCVHADLAPAT